MIAAGVRFVRPPSVASYGTVAVFEDLYGNRWDLIELGAAARSDADATTDDRRERLDMHPRAAELIATLKLRPHPEGGFYREIFRSTTEVAPADDRGSRAALTTIYFLLREGDVSRWHRVTSDEVWHLYEGGPLELLGPIGSGEDAPVCTIRAGQWQAARPLTAYVLVGCTVGPGFDFADFRLLADDPERSANVREEWPDVAELI
jgi:predicted cupin superfamily sugar epimerase